MYRIKRLKNIRKCKKFTESSREKGLDKNAELRYNVAQHSTAQHSTAQHSTAQHSTADKFAFLSHPTK